MGICCISRSQSTSFACPLVGAKGRLIKAIIRPLIGPYIYSKIVSTRRSILKTRPLPGGYEISFCVRSTVLRSGIELYFPRIVLAFSLISDGIALSRWKIRLTLPTSEFRLSWRAHCLAELGSSQRRTCSTIAAALTFFSLIGSDAGAETPEGDFRD